jgi:hypothetical protein
MYYQYPLESLARARRVVSQIEFAQRARAALSDSDELLARPRPSGLALFAANEEALEQPVRILRELYGDFVELRPSRARIIPGNPAQEPIMSVRVVGRVEHAGAIVAELRRRCARIDEECVRGRTLILRAEAPLALLLGFPGALRTITGGSATPSIRLVRYEPVASGPAAA